ncbi:MAG: T9SS type A sorting domain-containing protein [Chitinophagales bacterium]|nr:T9SS type A sorting domain-containing protein [Chitinophagales bacterium]
MKKNLLTTISIFLSYSLFAQFPGAAGTDGSTAIHKDSSIFSAWATECSVIRGYKNIENQSLGYASAGDASLATGLADAVGIVSLGDGGQAVLQFQNPIINGEGFDFAVFENSFNDNFLELAFVEVSSDGENFFRFSAISNSPTDIQTGTFGETNPTLIHNLAGKYRANYGTPFDLEELKETAGLDVNNITHVKIIDVIGIVKPGYASYDINNNPINDPFPTPFESSGFDLDAVGVIHQKRVNTSIKENNKTHLILYPNPIQSHQKLQIASSLEIKSISVYQLSGKSIFAGKLADFETNHFAAGVYFIQIETTEGLSVQKLTIQP